MNWQKRPVGCLDNAYYLEAELETLKSTGKATTFEHLIRQLNHKVFQGASIALIADESFDLVAATRASLLVSRGKSIRKEVIGKPLTHLLDTDMRIQSVITWAVYRLNTIKSPRETSYFKALFRQLKPKKDQIAVKENIELGMVAMESKATSLQELKEGSNIPSEITGKFSESTQERIKHQRPYFFHSFTCLTQSKISVDLAMFDMESQHLFLSPPPQCSSDWSTIFEICFSFPLPGFTHESEHVAHEQKAKRHLKENIVHSEGLYYFAPEIGYKHPNSYIKALNFLSNSEYADDQWMGFVCDSNLRVLAVTNGTSIQSEYEPLEIILKQITDLFPAIHVGSQFTNLKCLKKKSSVELISKSNKKTCSSVCLVYAFDFYLIYAAQSIKTS